MSLTTRVCLNHPNVQASAACKQCAKPLCGSCVTRNADGSFCGQACYDLYRQFKDRRVMNNSGSGLLGQIMRWAVYLAIAFGVVWAAAEYGDVAIAQKIMRLLGVGF
jgi:hypothetical protein